MKKSQRLAFLLMEGEPSHNLSTRKLLLESAKHTVINAYGSEEGVELFWRFPNVDAVIVDSSLNGCERAAKKLREHKRNLPIISLDSHIGASSKWADKTVSSYDPAALLRIARLPWFQFGTEFSLQIPCPAKS